MRRFKDILIPAHLLLLISVLTLLTAQMRMESSCQSVSINKDLHNNYSINAPDLYSGLFQQPEKHGVSFQQPARPVGSNPCNIGINNKVLSYSQSREKAVKGYCLVCMNYLREKNNNSGNVGHDYLIYALREIII